ncbi:hypothetical protein BC833DRAFT_600656 [Globomyces pollinis-pini]|nr:hypothetical protein BC833DRAFT_600656 [Globomyces pollinis-pini]
MEPLKSDERPSLPSLPSRKTPLPPLSKSPSLKNDELSMSTKSKSFQNNPNDLVSSLLSRLTKVEKLCSTLKTSLLLKDATIVKLEARIEQLTENDDNNDYIHSLESHIAELEDIIASYDSRVELLPNHSSSSQLNKADTFPFDMARIRISIEQLNYDAGLGTTRLVKNGDVGTFKNVESVPLRIYRNGIYFKNGPFRSFANDKSALSFLNDIQDCYFPYELKTQYPDGVPFELMDNHEKYFVDPMNQTNVDIHPVNPTTSMTEKISSVESNTEVPQSSSLMGLNTSTTECFISKLPKYVIRNGYVVNVRSGIQQLLSGVSMDQNEMVNINLRVKQPNQHSIKLKIFNRNKPQVISVLAGSSTTVKEVKNAIYPYICKNGDDSRLWGLKLALTKTDLIDEQTLQEAGIGQNAVLHCLYTTNTIS